MSDDKQLGSAWIFERVLKLRQHPKPGL